MFDTSETNDPAAGSPSGASHSDPRPATDPVQPEAKHLWAAYQNRQKRFSPLYTLTVGILVLLTLAGVAIGLWIVAFR